VLRLEVVETVFDKHVVVPAMFIMLSMLSVAYRRLEGISSSPHSEQ